MSYDGDTHVFTLSNAPVSIAEVEIGPKNYAHYGSYFGVANLAFTIIGDTLVTLPGAGCLLIDKVGSSLENAGFLNTPTTIELGIGACMRRCLYSCGFWAEKTCSISS